MTYETGFEVPPERQEVIITRLFGASPERVFAAHVDATLIPLWWGPRYLTTNVERLEARPGGQWRYIQRAADGAVHAFHGVFHLADAPRRLVTTFEYEGTPGQVLLNDVRFEAVTEGTRLIQKSVYLSVADRDAMVQAGMRGGLETSMERLDELFAAS